MSGPRRNRWIEYFLVASAIASTALCQDAHGRAETLFNEGKKLMDSGHAAEGCVKLEESVKLVRGGGNTLSLGLCYETVGKVASAHKAFSGALALAKEKSNAERQTIAAEHLSSLGPRVPQLTVTAPAGASVTLDGQPLPPPWTAVPVDPGTHAVSATFADGTKASEAVIVKEGAKTTVTLTPASAIQPPVPAPTTSATPPPSTTSSPPPITEDHGKSSNTLAYVSGGIGVAALGTGVVLGILAHGKHKDANDVCPSTACSSQAAVDDEKSANALAWGANVGFGVGLIGLGVATYLLVTAPPASAPSSGVRFVPLVAREGGGFGLAGTFR